MGESSNIKRVFANVARAGLATLACGVLLFSDSRKDLESIVQSPPTGQAPIAPSPSPRAPAALEAYLDHVHEVSQTKYHEPIERELLASYASDHPDLFYKAAEMDLKFTTRDQLDLLVSLGVQSLERIQRIDAALDLTIGFGETADPMEWNPSAIELVLERFGDFDDFEGAHEFTNYLKSELSLNSVFFMDIHGFLELYEVHDSPEFTATVELLQELGFDDIAGYSRTLIEFTKPIEGVYEPEGVFEPGEVRRISLPDYVLIKYFMSFDPTHIRNIFSRLDGVGAYIEQNRTRFSPSRISGAAQIFSVVEASGGLQFLDALDKLMGVSRLDVNKLDSIYRDRRNLTNAVNAYSYLRDAGVFEDKNFFDTRTVEDPFEAMLQFGELSVDNLRLLHENYLLTPCSPSDITYLKNIQRENPELFQFLRESDSTKELIGVLRDDFYLSNLPPIHLDEFVSLAQKDNWRSVLNTLKQQGLIFDITSSDFSALSNLCDQETELTTQGPRLWKQLRNFDGFDNMGVGDVSKLLPFGTNQGLQIIEFAKNNFGTNSMDDSLLSLLTNIQYNSIVGNAELINTLEVGGKEIYNQCVENYEMTGGVRLQDLYPLALLAKNNGLEVIQRIHDQIGISLRRSAQFTILAGVILGGRYHVPNLPDKLPDMKNVLTKLEDFDLEDASVWDLHILDDIRDTDNLNQFKRFAQPIHQYLNDNFNLDGQLSLSDYDYIRQFSDVRHMFNFLDYMKELGIQNITTKEVRDAAKASENTVAHLRDLVQKGLNSPSSVHDAVILANNYDLITKVEGSVELYNQRGIMNFHRYGNSYDQTLLQEMVRTLDPEYKQDLPLVVIVNNNSDWNGAFAKTQTIWNMQALTPHYRVIISELGNEAQWESNVRDYASRYGRNGKIKGLINGGHGSQTVLHWGENDAKHDWEHFYMDVSDRAQFARMANLFDEHAWVIQESCLNAQGGQGVENLANLLHEVWPDVTIYASKISTRGSIITVGENGKINVMFAEGPDVTYVVGPGR